MPAFLITGAAGPLGKALVPRMAKMFPDLSCLALTSRYPKNLNFSGSYIRPLLLDLNQDFYGSSFLSEIAPLAPFDSIIHCASPYPTELIMQVSANTFADFSRLIANELCLLRELTLYLKPKGSLIICGSISGMRPYNSFSENPVEQPENAAHSDKFKPCTLHAMHKGIVRDFAYRLYCGNLACSVVHLNLGPFMTAVPKEKSDEILSAAVVAESVIKIIKSKNMQAFNVDILSEITANKLRYLYSGQESSKVSDFFDTRTGVPLFTGQALEKSTSETACKKK